MPATAARGGSPHRPHRKLSDERRLLTVSQAASELGISSGHLRRAIRKGEIPAFRLGARTLRVFPADLYRWVRKHQVPACDHATKRGVEICADLCLGDEGAGRRT